MRRFVVLTAAVTILTSITWVPTASARAPGWTQLNASDPQYGGGFLGISCVTASLCTAVGFKSQSGSRSNPGALVERWNGSSFRTQNAPAGQDFDVSCLSRNFCMVVGLRSGTSGTNASSARWTGTRWRSVTMPAARDAYLQSVSCWSSKGCVAVGQTLPVSYARPLIERWNGTRWRIQKSPTGSQYANHLSGVSCVSAAACLAVGQTFLDAQGRNSKTLAERWNGKSWRIIPSPTQAKTTQPWLHAISCITATNCTAVGGNNSSSQIVHWDGSEFVTQQPATPPARTEAPTLTGVSCLTATFCMAVGVSNYPSQMEAEQWDGSTWTLATLPGGSRSDTFQSGGISCPNTSTCLADGMTFRRRSNHVLVDEWSAS